MIDLKFYTAIDLRYCVGLPSGGVDSYPTLAELWANSDRWGYVGLYGIKQNGESEHLFDLDKGVDAANLQAMLEAFRSAPRLVKYTGWMDTIDLADTYGYESDKREAECKRESLRHSIDLDSQDYKCQEGDYLEYEALNFLSALNIFFVDEENIIMHYTGDTNESP